MFKKLSIILLIVVLMSSVLQPNMVYSADINVKINGEDVAFNQDSGQPFIDSAQRTQVPLRITMEAYGCDVSWNNLNKIATVEKDGIKVEVPIGEAYIIVNGGKIVNDTTAQIKDGRTYLPIRVVIEAFGEEVKWDAITNSVIVGRYTKYNISPERTMYLYVYNFDNKGFDEKDINKADFIFKDGAIVKDGRSYILYKAIFGATKDKEFLKHISESYSKSAIYIYNGSEYVQHYDFFGYILNYNNQESYSLSSENNIAYYRLSL